MPQVLTAEEILDLVRQRFPGEEAAILQIIGQQAAILRAQLASDGGDLVGVDPPPGHTSGTLNALLAEVAANAAPAVHGHTIAQVTGLQAALDAKLDDAQATPAGLALLGAADAAAQRTALGLGNAATSALSTTNAAALGTAAPGSETTVARADHVHPMPTAAAVGAAPAVHTHAIADVTGLQSALDDRGRLSAANTWRATQTLAPLTGGGLFVVQKATATDISGFGWNNELGFRRWQLQTSGTGADDLWLVRFDESGTFQGTALFVDAVTGAFSYTAPTIFLNQIGQGATPTAGNNALYSAEFSGAAISSAAQYQGLITSAVTNTAFVVRSVPRTQAAVFTLPALVHYSAAQGEFGAGSSVTTQFGFSAANNLVGAGTNFGFHSAIPAGANRWNFFAAGTANNAFAGNVRIGSTAAPTVALDVTGSGLFSDTLSSTNHLAVGGVTTAARLNVGNNLSSSTAIGVLAQSHVLSSLTGTAEYFRTNATTEAASFTLSVLNHYSAVQSTIGAGSSITTQHGFFATASLIGATTNIGFRGNIPAGDGRWNFFADGTAVNAFAGNTRFGSTAVPTVPLDVTGNAAISGTLTLGGTVTSAVQAGTATGQLASWNQTTGRYEPATVSGGGGNTDWTIVTAGQTLADDVPLLADITTAATFPIPASVTVGHAYILRNASTSTVLASIDPGAGRQIQGCPVAGILTIAPGETVHLVARTSTAYEIV